MLNSTYRRRPPVLACLATLCLIGAARGDDPPLPDNLTEGSATLWGAAAQFASAGVFNDSQRVKVGASSLRFETDGGFDTWLWSPVAKNANWNFLAAGSGGISFWVYAENNNGPGFQSGSPWVRLYSSTNDYIEFHATGEPLNAAIGQWQQMVIPINGSAQWAFSQEGAPNLAAIKFIEIHADTWDSGFKLWFDGLRFDLPIPAPIGQKAYALNHKVELFWKPYSLPFGTFSHYAVYRSTVPFTSVTGMTPIATVPGASSTSYVDNTALNGVSYHYAVTAVLSGGSESKDVTSIGPRTPRDETDLQIACIARTPRYPRYAPNYTYYEITEPSGFGPYVFSAATSLGLGQNANTKRFPDLGEPVTYTATVRNRGTNAWNGTLVGQWTLDGLPAGAVNLPASLAPGQTTTASVVIPWDGQPHELKLALALADARPGNNSFTMDTKSVAFLSYIDRTYAEDFRENTKNYPQANSDDMIDWLNLHMQRFNEMFDDAGTSKRVHFDVLEVLEDDAPDPNIATIDFAIFPFRYRAGEGSLRLSGYYSSTEDLDFGLLHEMGHQLGLIDIYRLDMSPQANQVSNTGYAAIPCLMHGCSPFISPHSAGAMSLWKDKAHGYFGQYLYSTPAETRVRILGTDGKPLPNATITVYQKCERPGLGEVITTQAKAQGVTDSAGEWTIPNVSIDPNLAPTTFAGDTLKPNPFGYIAVIGTNGLLLLKIEHKGFTDYAWLDIIEVNNAYWAGQTGTAVFERKTALGGAIQYVPPMELTELNADKWAGWVENGTFTLTDDTTKKLIGGGSIRFETTGGFDNYVRYPGKQLALWDLSAVQQIEVSFFAENPNFSFQNASPWIYLRSPQGHYEYHPTTDLLNQAIGQWKSFTIPIGGNSTWPRTTFGSPSLETVSSIEIHADTWGAGFTMWVDGLRFSPQPCFGDLTGDGKVDQADLGLLLGDYGCTSGACVGDLDKDGDTDQGDLGALLGVFGTVCN